MTPCRCGKYLLSPIAGQYVPLPTIMRRGYAHQRREYHYQHDCTLETDRVEPLPRWRGQPINEPTQRSEGAP